MTRFTSSGITKSLPCHGTCFAAGEQTAKGSGDVDSWRFEGYISAIRREVGMSGARAVSGRARQLKVHAEEERASFEGKAPSFLSLSNQLDVPLGACNKEEPAAVLLDERSRLKF